MRQAEPGRSRRWVMLGVSVLAQTTSAFGYNGVAFLIPALQEDGLTLVQAGWVAAMPIFGVMLSLIGWGAAVDRFGERRILVIGLAGTALAATAAAFAPTLLLRCVLLVLFGAFGASTAAASGRVVIGWFPYERRGLAMGIRQMAQPLGVGLAAIAVAGVAERYSISAALLLPAGLAAGAAVLCAVLIIDPPRPSRLEAAGTGELANPYRRDSFLWRVHAVSVLLVIPQATIWTFMLVWLLTDQGWQTTTAGLLVAFTQLIGAFGRIGVGALSDRVGSRMRPLRWVAIAAAATMGMLALADRLDWAVAVPLMVAASVITVADNGLAFTAIAEDAGPFWSGRALGAQNTAQFLAAAFVPPAIGAVITLVGFPAAFALNALFPVAAVPLVPRSGRQRKVLESTHERSAA